MKTFHLCLGSSDNDRLRRFVQLPFGDTTHILAFGGEDGSISIIEGSTVKIARRFSETVRAVAPSHDGSRVAVGFGDGSITIYVYESLEGDVHPFLTFLRQSDADVDDAMFSLLAGMDDDETSFPGPRFQTPVRCLVFDPRPCYLLACASEDSGFCIVDATSSSTLSKKRFLAEQSASEHNETGIRGLAYYFQNNIALLASLDLQGRLCVWDVNGDDPELEYELRHKDGHKCVTQVDQGDINDSKPEDQACFPVFGKTVLGLPGSHDLQLRSVESVEKQIFVPSVEGKGHIDSIVSIAFAKDGKFAITSGRDKRIVVWKLEKDGVFNGRFYRCHTEEESICTHILWTNSIILFAFANGTFATSPEVEVIPDLGVANTTRKPASLAKPCDDVAPRKSLGTHKNRKTLDEATKKQPSEVDASDDEDVSFEKTPSKAKISFIDDEADEFDDENQSTGLDDAAETPMLEQVIEDEEDSFEEDNNLDTACQSKSQYLALPEPQPAFAPSSTPLDLPRRIMCWNHVGTITLLRGDEGVVRNTIAIDFTDSGFGKPVTFTDNMDFIVGSLGEDGACFATDLVDDPDDALDEVVDEVVHGLNMSEKTKAALKKNQRHRMRRNNDGFKTSGSSVYFHRFETFGKLSNKDWVITLPDGELVMGCATGQGWAACITNRRFLRLFTSGGNQGPVVWLKGEPVTIVGRYRFVAVFYHEGLPMPDGTQKLGFTVYDAISSEEITSGSLSCISARSSLTWAGFSKESSLMVMDSDGMLSMLVVFASRSGGYRSKVSWSWNPMLDTIGLRKSVEDSFWPVSVQDGKLICVPLKGGNVHPDAARRPVTTTLSLRMPFASGADRSTQLEELSVRANLALNQKKFNLEHFAYLGYDVCDEEDEYNRLCAQVDKVTLKLFMASVEVGKVERALDLVERLHLEKSFEIAITVADKMNFRALSDKIEIVKDCRFGVLDNEEEDTEDMFPDSQDDPVTEVSAPPQRLEQHNVSPDSQPISKFKRRIEEVLPDDSRSNLANTNPFAKKRMESPARPSLSPSKESAPRIGISRLSSFSAHSREMKRVGKKLL